MNEYDETCLEYFLEHQLQLFDEKVANNPEEAEEFLEDCMAVLVESADEVMDYFEEEGMDVQSAGEDEVLAAKEVFDIGDGRYLIVEG